MDRRNDSFVSLLIYEDIKMVQEEYISPRFEEVIVSYSQIITHSNLENPEKGNNWDW